MTTERHRQWGVAIVARASASVVGFIKPDILRLSSYEDAEMVKRRYEQTYPTTYFEVREFNTHHDKQTS